MMGAPDAEAMKNETSKDIISCTCQAWLKKSEVKPLNQNRPLKQQKAIPGPSTLAVKCKGCQFTIPSGLIGTP